MNNSRILLCLAMIVFLAACKQKKAGVISEDAVEAGDFIEYFKPVELPFRFGDTTLRMVNDSNRISFAVFKRFVPDSVISKVYGKETNLKVYPLGRVEGEAKEHYLLAGIKSTKSLPVAFYLLIFDRKDQYVTSMLPWRSDRDQAKSTKSTITIDKKFAITKTQLRQNADGSTSEGKEIHVFNSEGRNFQLVMTDALDDKITELINPIDTLQRKHKLSGDYTTGKMNLVSIRDGRKADRLSFFIHFEKNNGECTGELKGEAIIRSATLAEYRLAGDPCILQFKFTSSSVMLKELEGCGSHRGLRCSFDGVYPRKKEVKPKAVKSKTAGK